MTKKLKLVMATNNASKLREARAIAGDRIEILSLKDIGYDKDIEETADSLEGNALIKVRAIKEASGLDCFADDTGLMVDALNGAPGVHTARYAGEDCNPDKNIDLLLKNLEPAEDRKARFCTCVALSLDGEEHVFEGVVEGKIATERSGSHGFGYDPVFIPEETGVCFAEMSDEDKNAISHRGRAITAMMKWLSALCVCILASFQTHATSNSNDWRIFNTFDDKVESIFDTPEKTYILAQAQLYNKSIADNNKLLSFLFCRDKDSGEIRPYNALNFLSGNVINTANYNARRNYLLMVFEDHAIDILKDDGSLNTITALQSYKSEGSKDVRSISFDPELNRAYLATDFGYIVIDDKKNEVVSSGIYNEPIDKALRVADRFIILRNGLLYEDKADAKHLSLSDFKEVDWSGEGVVADILPFTSESFVLATTVNGVTSYYLVSFKSENVAPELKYLGKLANSYISENKDGILFARYGSIFQLDRNTNSLKGLVLREEDASLVTGSWDFNTFYFAKPREGVYSVRYDGNNTCTVLSQPARPNSPAVFRSTNLLYTPQHGMLANTHGVNQFFSSIDVRNPILLSGLQDQTWEMYGLPYLSPDTPYRLINPYGMAQDPDNPDVFYFGSLTNGLLRYNIKDMSSLLHMTKSNDSPALEGHVSIQDPYSDWSSTFMVVNPKFDSKGNLIVGHNNTEVRGQYFSELWIWPQANRRASTSPETFQPFVRIPLKDIAGSKNSIALPLNYSSSRDMIVFLTGSVYGSLFAVYDHNGTIEETADDRKVIMNTKKLADADGNLNVNYLYCAIEDPATGLVWVGTDNGVFTFDPKEAFTSPDRVSRIKVSRNDGTSLADYLLSGTSISDITIDGMGRKWFALAAGGLVCTSADGKNILQELNTDNSAIPSDVVYTTCYNPDNNSLLVATSSGLGEYYLSGQALESGSSSARAYPNPVRHDYYGYVTIDGLEEDCIVKIADSAGNLVRELGPASAGRVQWDVCGMDLYRVPSGVYFVLASSGPGGGSYSEVTKILVINR